MLPANGPSLILLTDCWWQWTLWQSKTLCLHQRPHLQNVTRRMACHYRLVAMLKIATTVTILPTWWLQLNCVNWRGKQQQLVGRTKEFPLHCHVIALISDFRCFIFRSVGSAPLAKFKQLVSVLGIPFHHLAKNKPTLDTLDSLGWLQCSYWQLWIHCCVFSLLCPGYGFSSEVQLGRRASSVWAVMKVGPRFCLTHKSSLPSLTHRPLFTLVAQSLITHSSGIVITGRLLQRRPSHPAAIRPLRVHIAGGSPVWCAPCRLETEEFQGSSLIPGWCVSAAAFSNPCAECMQSTGGLGTTSKTNPCK